MSTRTSAARYAKALFDVTVREGGLESVERDLSGFGVLFEQNDDLRKALLNPAVPTAAKRGVVEQIMLRAAAPPPLAKLLALLADRDRLDLVPELASVYRERLREHQHVVRAEVVTAVALTGDRAAAIEKRLATAVGQTVAMSTRVDPALIGGVVARIGSTVYDGSIATQLARMRHKLVENV